MKQHTKPILATLLALMFATATILAGCTATGDGGDATSLSMPDSSIQSSSSSTSIASSRPVSSSSRASSSSTSQGAAPSSKPESATDSSSQPESAAAISSSQAQVGNQPVAQAPASSQPAAGAPPATETPAPQPSTPEPPPPPPATPSVDIDAVIAQGHAYAAERNMTMNGNAPSCLGPIDVTGRTQASVLDDLYAQFDVIYAELQAIPEYEPGMVVPCYNLTVSGSIIYLFFG